MGIEILAAVGTFATGLFGATLGTVATTAIGGAIVGAAVGGLTSAVMGGDIAQGMLFGAIGGAVTGGVGSAMGFGSTAGGATASSGQLMEGATQVVGNTAYTKGMGVIGGQLVDTALVQSVAPTATGIMGTIGEGGTLVAGKFIEKGLEYALTPDPEETETPWANTEEGVRAQLESSERKAGISAGPAYAQIAENRRQYDDGRQEFKEQRQYRREQFSELRKDDAGGEQVASNTSLQEHLNKRQGLPTDNITEPALPTMEA